MNVLQKYTLLFAVEVSVLCLDFYCCFFIFQTVYFFALNQVVFHSLNSCDAKRSDRQEWLSEDLIKFINFHLAVVASTIGNSWSLELIFMCIFSLWFYFLLKRILETRRLTLNNDPGFLTSIKVRKYTSFHFEHTKLCKPSIKYNTEQHSKLNTLEKKSEWSPNNARLWKDLKCVATTNQRTEWTSNSWTAPFHSHRFSCTQYAFIQVFIWYSQFVQQPRAHWSWNIQICLILCIVL